jgi:acyl-CoA thioesterase I
MRAPLTWLLPAVLALGLAGTAFAQEGGSAGADNGACGAPQELTEATAPLPFAARAIAAGRMQMLVVGSASALGPGTSGPEAIWPNRLKALLTARLPQLKIEMTVEGRRGLTATDHLEILEQELAHRPPQLVIWQAGTVEAMRAGDVQELTENLGTGIERLRAAGADTVLMDQQFSRFLRANVDIEPYQDAMHLVATAQAVPLLRRYQLMRHWAEAGTIDVERAARPDRVAETDRLNDCLARAVTTLLLNAIAAAQQRAEPPAVVAPR